MYNVKPHKSYNNTQNVNNNNSQERQPPSNILLQFFTKIK